jgi:Na+/phosphate symporter
MKTTINTKQLTTYLLPAIAIGLLFAIFPVSFSLLGYIQFFVGLFQLAIALFKLIYI